MQAGPLTPGGGCATVETLGRCTAAPCAYRHAQRASPRVPAQELVLLEKEKELLEREQTVMVLREEVRARACPPPRPRCHCLAAGVPTAACLPAACGAPRLDGGVQRSDLRGAASQLCCHRLPGHRQSLPPPTQPVISPEPTHQPAMPCGHPQHQCARSPPHPPLPDAPPSLQLEIEKKLRTLLTKEKEKAEEEATLAMGLCTGGSMLP